MAGLWQIRGDHLQTLHDDATDLLKELSSCTGTVQFHHVPRNSNVEADALANQAISNPDPIFVIMIGFTSFTSAHAQRA